MDRLEAEPRPSLAEIQAALERQFQWVMSWEQKVRERYRLTPDIVMGTAHDIRLMGAALTVTSRSRSLYSLATGYNIPSNWGPVNLLQFEQTGGNAKQPLMARLFYRPGEQLGLVGVSFGWRYETSDILYEMVDLDGGQLRRVRKVVKPGVLFSCPEVFARFAAIGRGMTQLVEFSFLNDASGQLTGWTSELGFERSDLGRLQFREGEIVGSRGGVHFDGKGQYYYHFLGETHSLPTGVDPITYLKDLMTHESPNPLII